MLLSSTDFYATNVTRNSTGRPKLSCGMNTDTLINMVMNLKRIERLYKDISLSNRIPLKPSVREP